MAILISNALNAGFSDILYNARSQAGSWGPVPSLRKSKVHTKFFLTSLRSDYLLKHIIQND